MKATVYSRPRSDMPDRRIYYWACADTKRFGGPFETLERAKRAAKVHIDKMVGGRGVESGKGGPRPPDAAPPPKLT